MDNTAFTSHIYPEPPVLHTVGNYLVAIHPNAIRFFSFKVQSNQIVPDRIKLVIRKKDIAADLDTMKFVKLLAGTLLRMAGE